MRASFNLYKLMNIFLWPISFLWESIYKIRRFFFDYGIFHQKTFQVPIISIGNLTFGGTGKTPFTIWLSQYLAKRGRKVMILTRGYKGDLEKSSGILKKSRKMGFNAAEFGDEAILLARKTSNSTVVVGKNRSRNLDHYFHEEQPDVVILDDGHQHLKLERNLNIVLFDCLLPMERYKVAPLGYLREGLSALKDADLIILGRADQASEEKINDLRKMVRYHAKRHIPFAHMRYRPVNLCDCHHNPMMNLEDLKNKKVICIAAIASPQSFFRLIEKAGAEIINRVTYPDHHYYKPEELEELIAEAKKEDAYIVTTEKDIVKIRRIINDLRVLYLDIQVEFTKGKENIEKLVDQAMEIHL